MRWKGAARESSSGYPTKTISKPGALRPAPRLSDSGRVGYGILANRPHRNGEVVEWDFRCGSATGRTHLSGAQRRNEAGSYA